MMTLEQAIAEVKPVKEWSADYFRMFEGPSEDERSAIATILNAVASGDLIPRTDAEQAVAVMVQRAADVVPQGWCAEETKHTEMDVGLGQAIQAAILALAPADALAEAERIKAEIVRREAERKLMSARIAAQRKECRLTLSWSNAVQTTFYKCIAERQGLFAQIKAAEVEVALLRKQIAAMQGGGNAA